MSVCYKCDCGIHDICSLLYFIMDETFIFSDNLKSVSIVIIEVILK